MSTHETTAAIRVPRPPRPTLGGFASRFAVVGIWIGLGVVYTFLTPVSFLQYGTFRAIFGSQQGMTLVFLGMALVVVFFVGEFDLSVASNLGLSATIVPVLSLWHEVPLLVSVLIAVLSGVAVGLINGLFIVRLGINAIVVTLGMATLLLGIALLISNGATISGLPNEFAAITNTLVLGLPIGFYYAIAVALILSYVLTFTPLGRHMRFVGSNPEVARLSGVRVTAIRLGAYAVAGLLCGVGGVLLVAGLGSYDSVSSQQLLLPAFSAAFLGTAIIQPGQFNPLGTVIAVYFLATGILGLQILGLTGWVSNVFYGAALIIAVTISTIMRRHATRG